MVDRDDLVEFRIARAFHALAAGDAANAKEWLAGVEGLHRPKELLAAIEYELAKQALARQAWMEAEDHLVAAGAAGHDPFHQQRLALLRRRKPLMNDHTWQVLTETVDEAVRLPARRLAPQVTTVWASGAYYSRGRDSGAPWSRFLRLAKDPPSDDRAGTLSLAVGYLCRWIAERTPLLRHVDVVVPIPANALRYGIRMMSLPDELARGVEEQLAVPMAFNALRHTADDLELRGMSWAERRRAVVGSMVTGDLRLVSGRRVLVVDDVSTSGATLREAGRLLREGGAADVFAVCLAHTEG